MSVDLIENYSPAPAHDVHQSLENVGVGAGSPLVDAGPLPQVVVNTDVATNAVEAQLLLIAQGDLEALAALQVRMAGLVSVNVRRVLRDASRAAAVTENIFAELLQDAVGFDPARDDAQTWLLTRAHQHAMNGLRAADGTDHPSATATQPAPVLLV